MTLHVKVSLLAEKAGVTAKQMRTYLNGQGVPFRKEQGYYWVEHRTAVGVIAWIAKHGLT